ncbi:MAG: 3-deoxy-8-phosphooctulonate synthase [Methanosarcinaceae archaeon]
MTTNSLNIENITIGKGHPLALIAGPCVVESESIVLQTAEQILTIAEKLNMPFIFKASYLKDNRSSAKSYQGPGLDAGLKILQKVKEQFNIPVISDIHQAQDAKSAAEVLDIIQIPAYLSMQTSLTLAAAQTGKPLNIKKGQFLAPQDMQNVIRKVEETGNHQIMLTERGSCFGYHNLVVDMRALPIMRSLGYPVVIDPTHAIRVYGISSSDPAGGTPEYVPAIARAAVAAGCDAVFMETHPNCSAALCDAASMWPLQQLEKLLIQLIEIHNVVNKSG